MRKQLLITLLLIVSMMTINAKEVSQTEAEHIAKKQFYSINAADGMSYSDVRIVETFAIEEAGEVVYYAFNFEGDGFVIVSAEDAFLPIIGYSNDNMYVPNAGNQNYESFMHSFASEILWMRENQIVATPETAEKWEMLRAPYNTKFVPTEEVVSPLLLNLWNQDDPYNYYCPYDPAGPGERAYAGCVASAMSMILNHWRWPFQGEGSHSYSGSGYGTLSADFENSNYDPHGQIYSADNVMCEPLSLLMYHCGVSVNMMYANDGSGAYSTEVPNALKSYFKIASNVQHYQKDNYGTTAWINMLMVQLDDAHPVYYSGQEPGAGGHAFVCDGYDDNYYFHFNFGWSGYDNGFYPLSGASGVGGFYQYQAAVMNFVPDPNKGYPYYCYGNTELNFLQGSIGDGSGPVADYENNANASWLINPGSDENIVEDISMSFYKLDLANGDILKVYDGGDASAELLGEYTGNTLPEEITSTGDQLFVEFITDGSGTANGFLLEWESTVVKFCNGLTTYTEPSGSFGDGSGDYFYANGSTCMFVIEPDWATGTTLTIDSFDTEEADKLKIYAGDDLLEELSGTYSTGDLPGPYYSDDGTFTLVFNSNPWVNGPGFEVSYEADNVAVEETMDKSALQIMPNPATTELTVVFNSVEAQNVSIQLYSITGKLLFNDYQNAFKGRYSNTLNVADYAKGVYFLKVECNGEVNTEKVILK